jgi:hypothetical protein
LSREVDKLSKVVHIRERRKNMLNVQVTEENVNIVFSRNLVSDKDLVEFLEKVRLKNLISKSQFTEENLKNLDNQLKSNWWKKNRDRFLAKIK